MSRQESTELCVNSRIMMRRQIEQEKKRNIFVWCMPNQIKLIFDLLIDWRIIFCGNLLICQNSVSYFHILFKSRLLSLSQ